MTRVTSDHLVRIADDFFERFDAAIKHKKCSSYREACRDAGLYTPKSGNFLWGVRDRLRIRGYVNMLEGNLKKLEKWCGCSLRHKDPRPILYGHRVGDTKTNDKYEKKVNLKRVSIEVIKNVPKNQYEVSLTAQGDALTIMELPVGEFTFPAGVGLTRRRENDLTIKREAQAFAEMWADRFNVMILSKTPMEVDDMTP